MDSRLSATPGSSGTGSAKRPKTPLLTSQDMPNATTPIVSRKNSACNESGGSKMLLRATRMMVPVDGIVTDLEYEVPLPLGIRIFFALLGLGEQLERKEASRSNRAHVDRRCAVDTSHPPVQGSASCSVVGKRATPMAAGWHRRRGSCPTCTPVAACAGTTGRTPRARRGRRRRRFPCACHIRANGAFDPSPSTV